MHSVEEPRNEFKLYGLVEDVNSNGEMFSIKQLKNPLQASKDHNAETIKNHIRDAALAFYGDQFIEDDVTLIVAKIK
ncbi:SpoIIE family protein phosphatase [Deltaproteobacteria bacterium TL4]